MRVLRDGRAGVMKSYPRTDQHSSSLGRAQQLWNEWEIQCLVLVSFSLQAFLLFFTGIRKRVKSSSLNAFLWLAYLSADSVAIFVLGRLTLHVNDPGQELLLFWAPFLLLHLGGQETMTALSMEDNTLWRRHLLTLATQVALAIYIVGKQWRGDKQLVAPMVLMFIVGTMKYAGRIWTLMIVGWITPHIRSFATSRDPEPTDDERKRYHRKLSKAILENPEMDLDSLLRVARTGFIPAYSFLMNMAPPSSTFRRFKSSHNPVHIAYKLVELHLSLIYDILYTKFRAELFPRGNAMYMLITFCFTSTALALFVRADQKGLFIKSNGADVIISYVLLVGAITLEISSIFVGFISSYWPYTNIEQGPFFSNYCDIQMGYPPKYEDSKCVRRMLLRIGRHLHPESRGEWSEKLPQYNLIDTCIPTAAADGVLHRAILWIVHRDVTHVHVSPELKTLLLDKLLEIAAASQTAVDVKGEWDHTKFSGQWARLVIEAAPEAKEAAVLSEAEVQVLEAHEEALKAEVQVSEAAILSESKVQVLDFVSSVLLWHVVTDICFFYRETDDEFVLFFGETETALDYENTAKKMRELDNEYFAKKEMFENEDLHQQKVSEYVDLMKKMREFKSAMRGFKSARRELSNYVMYLVAKRHLMVGDDGRYVLHRGRKAISGMMGRESITQQILRCGTPARAPQDHSEASSSGGSTSTEVKVDIHPEAGRSGNPQTRAPQDHSEVDPGLRLAGSVSAKLLEIPDPRKRWDLIAAVWMEMLCYMAINCESGFHAKHLCTGGEFLTHVKMLLFVLGFPFRRDDSRETIWYK